MTMQLTVTDCLIDEITESKFQGKLPPSISDLGFALHYGEKTVIITTGRRYVRKKEMSMISMKHTLGRVHVRLQYVMT